MRHCVASGRGGGGTADRLWQLRMANSGYFAVFSNLDMPPVI